MVGSLQNAYLPQFIKFSQKNHGTKNSNFKIVNLKNNPLTYYNTKVIIQKEYIPMLLVIEFLKIKLNLALDSR